MNKLFVILLASAIFALTASASIKSPKKTIDFDHFWTFAEIDDYLEFLLEDYPELTFEETHGRTAEGRDIEAFVVRRGGATGTPKPTIIIESGLRAREWLGPMTAAYIIHEIVEHYYEFEDILDKVDLVFIPVANPDGYVFSFTAGGRNWNKNRRAVGSGCMGVDLNRNFQFSFSQSSDPCSENFSGLNFFSEAETQAIRSVIDAYLPRTRMYLSLQSFGQQIVFPYQSVSIPSSSQARFLALATQAAQSITTRSYAVGAAGALNGLEGGTSLDFAYAQRRIPLAFTMRLPRGGASGWDFPANQLAATLSESFNAFYVFVKHVADSA